MPTVTTSLAGFGAWASCQKERYGVVVIERNDSNFEHVAIEIAESLLRFSRLNPEEVQRARKEAATIAKKADWKHFFKYYRQAYDIALRKRDNRIDELQNPRLL